MKGKINWRRAIWEVFLMVLGGAVFGVGVNMFIVPNDITGGGATGVGILLNYFTKLPLGAMVLFVNIPLFLCSFRVQGKETFFRTLLATVIMSVMIDAVAFLPPFTGDKLLASIYGGVLSGVGLSLFLCIGVTTGGSDLLARILQRRFPFLSVGSIIMGIDVVVVAVTAIVYRDINTALYSVVVIFLTSLVLDKILAGLDFAKLGVIVSDNGAELSREICKELERGVTFLEGKGAYSDKSKNVLLCVVKPVDVFYLKRIIHTKDPKAFVIFVSASEVYGEGFKLN